MISVRQNTPWYLRLLGYPKYRYSVIVGSRNFWAYASV